MSTVWFTSDTHYGHANVIQYSKRPFKDVEEMDEALIENWNEVVRPGDLVYHLGDFSFHRDFKKTSEISRRLLGQKYLIFGNHDKKLRKVKEFLSSFIAAKDLDSIKVGDQRIVLCHYAMLTWNQSHRGAWQLHGHSHGSLPESDTALRIDVGVDPRSYRPISFEEIREIMSRKVHVPVDHHDERE